MESMSILFEMINGKNEILVYILKIFLYKILYFIINFFQVKIFKYGEDDDVKKVMQKVDEIIVKN